MWIPINEINDMYMCQSEGTDTDGNGTVDDDEYKSCKITVKDGEAYCTTHSSTQMAGRMYATGTGESFKVKLTTQTYSANSGLREPAVVTGNDEGTGEDYDNKDTYLGYLNGILGTSFAITTSTDNTGTANTDFKTYLQKEYNEVVKSVYLNGGFYVGRYETSNITASSGTAVQVVKEITNGIHTMNWYYMYAQQVKYAENKGSSVGSTMIQGAAYDQVMNFVNGAKDGENNDYYVTSYSSKRHTGSIAKTGANLYDKVKNIYDLEGNVLAWTTEAFWNGYRIGRGGSFTFSNSSSDRENIKMQNSSNGLGSLIQLFVQ